jgi:hypothetical protein
MRRSHTLVAVFALVLAGCSKDRPSDVANQPGDSYCELSDAQFTVRNGELKLKVKYTFPDGPPKHDAWFACVFDIVGSSTSTVTVRKQGKELYEKGEFDATTNIAFLRSLHAKVTITVRQAASKNGPYHDVSARQMSQF